MIAPCQQRRPQRRGLALRYLQDGYRVLVGKPPKHTVDPAVRDAAFAAARRGLKLDENTVSEKEWELLAKLLGEVADHPGPIIEIGVLAGRTTQRLARHKAPHQTILAVDNFCWNPWGLSRDEQWGLVRHSLDFLVQTGHVEIVRSDKDDFFAAYDGPPPALVFLDAIHDYPETRKDILWARRVGAAVVTGHDYSPKFPGVMQIVDELGGPAELAGTVFRLGA